MAARRERPAAAALLLLCGLALAAAQPGDGGGSNGNGTFSGTPRRTLPLSGVPGCGSEVGGDELIGGLDTNCLLEGQLGPRETLAVTFTVSDTPKASTGEFNLLIQLRTVRGVARLGLLTRDGPEAAFVGEELYATDTNSESYISLPATYMNKNPGVYTVKIVNPSKDPRVVSFKLQVTTPLLTTLLVEDEVAVMQDLAKQCCPSGNMSSLASEFCDLALPAAISPNRTASDDLCHLAPIVCDDEGHLQQLSLPGAGLDCGGKGLPDTFTLLAGLQTLDLAFNSIGGSTDDLAAILEKMPSLQRAFLRYTEIEGTLPCALVDNPSLVLLSVSGNPGVQGTIPDCFLTDPTIEELYMSHTGLVGGLPDEIPEGSPLRTLLTIGKGETDSPRLSGPLPKSLINAVNLTELDFSRNAYEGDIPALPPGLMVLNVSDNLLTALPPAMPPTIVTLDASYNQIKGTIPPISPTLELLGLEANELTGPLPGFAPAKRRKARRSLLRRLLQGGGADETTTLAEEGPALAMLFVARNQLTGTIPAEWASVPKRLEGFDVSQNKLFGRLPDGWELPELFAADFSDNQFEGTIPASLGEQQNLVFLNLQRNELTGPLDDFANSVATYSKTLMHLNLNGNTLTGGIPAALERTPILNTNGVATLAGVPLRRKMDLGNNSFTGPFPVWLVSAIPKEMEACHCPIIVSVNGPNADLACPTAEAAKEVVPSVGAQEKDLLGLYNFTCTGKAGKQISLLSALDGSEAPTGAAEAEAKAAADAAAAPPPKPKEDKPAAADAPAPAPAKAGGGGMPANAGTIAGGVVGGLAAIGIAAGAAMAFRRRARLRRQGWEKEELGGPGPAGFGGGNGGNMDSAFGIMPAAPAVGGSTGYPGGRVEMSSNPRV